MENFKLILCRRCRVFGYELRRTYDICFECNRSKILEIAQREREQVSTLAWAVKEVSQGKRLSRKGRIV